MATARPRPLSPHLTVWRWRVHALVSITHRITGSAMSLVGVPLFVWWLVAAATGPEAYATFYDLARSPIGYLVGVGFTYVFFQHMMSGLRHLVMDTGAGFELTTAKKSAALCYVGAVILTAITWFVIYSYKGF
jgi:succinate dehydrogenase / fumarate reductase cytochrome b subunit